MKIEERLGFSQQFSFFSLSSSEIYKVCALVLAVFTFYMLKNLSSFHFELMLNKT